MSVLHITARADVGGGPEVLFRLATASSSREIYIACPNEAPFFQRFTSLLGPDRIVTIPHRSFTIRALIQLRDFIIERKISVIHSHGFGAGLYGRILRLLTGRPCVHTYHGFLLAGPGMLTRASRALVEIVLFPLTEIPVAVSATERGRILRWFRWAGRRVVSIPNGVSSSSVSAVLTQSIREPLRILTVGRLVEQKSPLALLQVAEHLRDRQRLDRFRFVVVGDGPLAASFRDRIREGAMEGAFEMVGETYEPAKFYALADVYLSPSRDEAFGLAVFDAMLHGLAVVATDINGHKDAIRHASSGLLFPWGDWQAAAEFLIRLADEPSLRTSLASEAQKTILRDYSVTRMANSYEECYRAALRACGGIGELEKNLLN
jgi:glycosyltransferase involved in cell wall biosynthesis